MPHPDAKEIPGGRLVHKFPSDLTLWKVLRQFESGDGSNNRNINITARGVAQTVNGTGSGGSGQLYYETPVLNIMGRELSTFVDFQKTLSQLGYNSGNVLIRLSYKMTEQTLYEAMEQISQYFQEARVETKDAAAPAGEQQQEDKRDEQTQDAVMADAPPAQAWEAATQESQPASSAEVNTENDSVVNSSRAAEDRFKPVNVFLAPSGSSPAAASAPIVETDYTPSIAHAKLHQSRLQESSRNKRLLSDREIEEKEAAEQAKLDAIKSVLVKVRFPDNTSSDWEVGPSENGAFLYEAVRHVMSSDRQPFRLVLPGGKTAIKDDSSSSHNLIRVYKLSGRVLVSLVWEDAVPADVRKRPFLKSTVAQQGKAVEIPEVPQAAEEPAETQNTSGPAKPEKKEESSGSSGAKKLPKWLKLGKK